jgi:TRAP-type uncharacterized transport system fused permease subunit
VFITVHFEAKRLGLRKIPRDEMPNLGATLRRDGYLLLPIAALIGFLYTGFSEEMAALMAVGATFLVSFVRRAAAKVYAGQHRSSAAGTEGVRRADGVRLAPPSPRLPPATRSAAAPS